MCMGLCGAQPRDTNNKPISSLPLAPRPHRRWNRGVGGARPPGLKVDPLLNASPSFGSIHLINSTPQVKFPPSLPSSPPPPPPQCLTFIRINTFDQFCPPGTIFCRPSAPPFPSIPSPLQCLTFIGINPFDQFRPQVKFLPPATLPPASPPPPSLRIITKIT